MLHEGKSPLNERKKVSEWTFERVARLLLDNWKADKSEKHANGTKSRLEANIFPKIGAMSIDTITTQIIVILIKDIGSRGALDIANRALQKINQIFRFANHDHIGYNWHIAPETQ